MNELQVLITARNVFLIRDGVAKFMDKVRSVTGLLKAESTLRVAEHQQTSCSISYTLNLLEKDGKYFLKDNDLCIPITKSLLSKKLTMPRSSVMFAGYDGKNLMVNGHLLKATRTQRNALSLETLAALFCFAPDVHVKQVTTELCVLRVKNTAGTRVPSIETTGWGDVVADHHAVYLHTINSYVELAIHSTLDTSQWNALHYSFPPPKMPLETSHLYANPIEVQSTDSISIYAVTHRVDDVMRLASQDKMEHRHIEQLGEALKRGLLPKCSNVKDFIGTQRGKSFNIIMDSEHVRNSLFSLTYNGYIRLSQSSLIGHIRVDVL